MIFAKVDVGLPTHHRMLRIPARIRAESLGVWLAALCYSRGDELDGFCPLEAIDQVARAQVIEQLVTVGLMTRDEQDGMHGVRILRYAEHNETKSVINDRKTYDRHRKASKGRAHPESGVHTVRTPTGFPSDSERNPFGFPSQGIPDSDSDSDSDSGSLLRSSETEIPEATPPPKTEPKRKRQLPTPIAPDWQPSPDVLALFAAEGTDAAAYVPNFRDYWLGEGKPKADWAATFRGWVRRDVAKGNVHTMPRGAPANEFASPSEPYLPPAETQAMLSELATKLRNGITRKAAT